MNQRPLYNVRYDLLNSAPQQLEFGAPLLLTVELTNLGLVPWITFGEHPVHLAYHWRTKRGQTVVEDGLRTPLPTLMPPDAHATVEMRVQAPPGTGEYELVVDLVEEDVAWFSQRGVTPLVIPVTYFTEAAPRACIINGNCSINDAVGNSVVAQLRTLKAAGFQTLFLTEFIDERLPADVLSSSVVLRLEDLQRPTSRTRAAAEHFYASDVILLNYSTYYKLAEAIKLARRGAVIFDYHGVTPPELWDPNSLGYQDVVRGQQNVKLVQYADQAIAHSQFTRSELVQTGLIPADRVHLIPLSMIKNSTRAKEPNLELLNRYGLHGKRVLLFVGRMARNKRIIDLVEALPLVLERHPETVLLLIGDNQLGPFRDYANEVKQRARELGCSDHVIFTGQVPDLDEFYQLCDLFVTASMHEGFGVPVIEAMAHGKPVVAAAATALPHTVGDAGLLFEPKNTAQLAQQINRLLDDLPPDQTRRKHAGALVDMSVDPLPPQTDRAIVFVTPRYGLEIIGGAERLIRGWAEHLAERGYKVEVLTSCTLDMGGWKNHYTPGVEELNGVTVRRFLTDRVRPETWHHVLVKANQGEYVTYQDELEFVHNNLQSSALNQYLREHRDEFVCAIFAPYLFGTTYWGMQQLPDKAIIVPCLHNEPSARLSVFREMLEGAAGLFFNTEAECDFATDVLNVVNPYRTVVGYGFDPNPTPGDSAAFRAKYKLPDQILLYSGRLEGGKNVPLLLDYFVRYKQAHPGPLTLVLTGAGDVPIPRRSDIVALGVLPEAELPHAFAAALALCQPSLNESFSIVMMESWLQGRPVLVHADCAVTSAHVRASGGGDTFNDYPSFCAALQRLVTNPTHVAELGQRGRTYVLQNYTWDAVLGRLLQGVAVFTQPRSEYERLSQRGIQRSLAFTPTRVNDQLLQVVESILTPQQRKQLRRRTHNGVPDYMRRSYRVAVKQVVGWARRKVAVRLGIWDR